MTGESAARDLEFLLEAGRRLNRAPELAALLAEVRDLAKSAVSARACSLLLWNEERTRLEVYLGYDHILPEPRLHLAAGEGLAGAIAEHGEGVLANDVPNDPRFRRQLEQNFDFETLSFLGVPVRRGDTVIGVLAVMNKTTGEFLRADQTRLETLSEQIAIALDTALLVRRLEHQTAANEALYKIGLVLSQKLDLEDILEALLDQVRWVVPYEAGAVYLIHWDTRELEWFAERGYDQGTVERVRLKLGMGAVGWAAREGVPLVIPDVRRESRYVIARDRTLSEVVVPIVSEGRVIAVFNLESDREDNFRPEDVRVLTTFANQAGLSIQRAQLFRELRGKERLENELEIAREIQRSFLPGEAPSLPGFEVAGLNVPSREVSGDSFDFVPITRDHLGIMIGDVSGKGVPAALILATFRASLRSEIRNEYSIKEIMGKVNRLLYESVEPGKFVTAIYGVLDVTQRVFTYANAGHNPPFLLRPHARPRELSEGGLILGSFADATYQEGRVELKPGDLLVFYTDGVTDAGEPGMAPFGNQRLVRAVQKQREKSALRICQAILDEVQQYAGDLANLDDRTVVVLKVLPEGGAGE